jgi:phage tail-like protein
MPQNLQPISQKQFLVNIQGIQSYFSKVTKPKESRAETTYNDGQTGEEYTHLDFIKREKITLSKVFYPATDKALVNWWNERKTKADTPFNISIQPIAADTAGSPISGAGTIILNNCFVQSFSYPEVDRMGSGMAMLEIEVVVNGAISYQ